MTNTPGDQPIRWIIAAAGLLGAGGIVAAAAASHGPDARLLGAVSTVCLANAPALLVLGLAGRHLRLASLSAALLALGTVLFSADVALRALFGTGLFPMAAPTGGTLMIFGWLVIALAALILRSSRE